MRRSQGVLLPPIPAGRFKRARVYRGLREAVLDGALAAGDRLPSTRKAAGDYSMSRGLMEEVYAQLADEGLLERETGRGTFVAAGLARLLETSAIPRNGNVARNPSRRGLQIAGNAFCREPEEPPAFNAGVADSREFPWKTWCRLQVRAARELGPKALSFSDPRGLLNLRAAIARHLAHFRGLRCNARQVVIFNSAQQALNTLAILMLNRGDAAWIEDPCYLGARAALEMAGATAVPVPVDQEGIVVDKGIQRAPRARLAYVTPPHQYPTGVALSLDRRIELLQWAHRQNSWIVEDDYDGEFRYAAQPLPSLYSLDSRARVFYLGTLNKATFVSLRLAYVVVPEEFVELLANIRTQVDGFSPVLAQMTMSLFMEEGHFSSHLRRMRQVYGAKRKLLEEGLAPLAARGWTWSDNQAGMHLLVRHKDGSYVRGLTKRTPLDLALLSTYRFRQGRGDGLFLRFGGLDPAHLATGIEQLIAAL